MTMTKAEQAEKEAQKQEAIEYLRNKLPQGSKVYTLTTYAERSSSSRRWVRCFIVDSQPYHNGGKPYILEISGRVSDATGRQFVNDNKHYGIVVDGYGFSAANDVVSALGVRLYPDAPYGERLTDERL